jgi:hypothetical protein
MSQEEVYEPSGPSGGPPKQNRGCLGKSIMILGIIAAICLVVCCGAGIWLWTKFRGSITTKPAEVVTIRERIADIDIPEDMQPAFGMDVDFFGIFGWQLAAYGNDLEAVEGEQERTYKGTFLMLMQMNVKGDQQEIEAQLRNQSGEQGPDIRVEERQTRTVTIDGEELDFEFARGTNTEDNRQVRSVSGMFHGRGGPTLFMLVVPEEDWNAEGWNDERAIQLLESIHK